MFKLWKLAGKLVERVVRWRRYKDNMTDVYKGSIQKDVYYEESMV